MSDALLPPVLLSFTLHIFARPVALAPTSSSGICSGRLLPSRMSAESGQ